VLRYLFAMLSFPAAAQAAQIDRLDVSKSDDDRYQVTMDVRLDAPAARAYAVFSDPAMLPAINPAVKVARIVGGVSPTFDLYTEVYVCAALFCRTLKQTQKMQLAPASSGGRIVADVQPAVSDFSYGHAEWVFSGDGPSSALHFTMQVEPAFWVPPVIGPWLIARSLRAEAERTSAGIEKAAALQ
jgi:hypothetical protein